MHRCSWKRLHTGAVWISEQSQHWKLTLGRKKIPGRTRDKTTSCVGSDSGRAKKLNVCQLRTVANARPTDLRPYAVIRPKHRTQHTPLGCHCHPGQYAMFEGTIIYLFIYCRSLSRHAGAFIIEWFYCFYITFRLHLLYILILHTHFTYESHLLQVLFKRKIVYITWHALHTLHLLDTLILHAQSTI